MSHLRIDLSPFVSTAGFVEKDYSRQIVGM